MFTRHSSQKAGVLGASIFLIPTAILAVLAVSAPAAATPKDTIQTKLTGACLYDARGAAMNKTAKAKYCACVVKKFIDAHKKQKMTKSQLLLVVDIWRGQRKWPAKPKGFSEFDYHAKSRCEKSTRA